VGDPMRTEERMALAEACRAFVEREILPHAEQWERDGQIPRELHLAAGTAGILGVGYPEAMGGQGGGVLDSLCVSEAMIRAGGAGGHAGLVVLALGRASALDRRGHPGAAV
jgi:acyl-CoA dehydrogenase